MKNARLLAKIVFMALLAWAVAAVAQDLAARTIRHRSGTVLTFDTTSSIQDEDAGWTLSNSKMKILSGIGTGATLNWTVLTNGANTATFHITNGIIVSITAP